MENITLDLFHPKKAELQEIAKKYEGLTINGLEDKEGLKKVHNARVELKGLRVQVKNTRLEYTRQFDQAKREAMGLEKELIGIIEPVERELEEQENAIKEEKERIKREKEEAQRKILQERVEKLALYDFVYSDLYQLSQMEEKEFGELLSDKREAFEKKKNEEVEKERIEEFNKMINSFKNKIINANTIEEIKAIEGKIEEIEEITSEVYNENFDNDIKKKIEMIAFDEKQEQLKKDQQKLEDEKKAIEDEKQKKIDEENAEKERQRIEKEANEKAEKKMKKTQEIIEDLEQRDLEYLMNYNFPFIKDEVDIQKIQDFVSTRIGKLEQEKFNEQEKIREQEKLAKQKKYKNFLKKNGVTQENIESGEYTISKNEDLKTITIFKKIDVFNY